MAAHWSSRIPQRRLLPELLRSYNRGWTVEDYRTTLQMRSSVLEMLVLGD